jgi:Holliday junction resolvasome RuvABC DNA-binding subunit
MKTGHQIRIVRKKTLKSDGIPCCGLALLVEDKIELASEAHGSKLSNDQKATAFLHESLHIISALHSLGFNEKTITKLELALYQYLHDNKLRF